MPNKIGISKFLYATQISPLHKMTPNLCNATIWNGFGVMAMLCMNGDTP